jgi:hypothetical protein
VAERSAVKKALDELVDVFEDDIGRRPWLREVGEILALTLHSPVEILPEPPEPPGGSQVAELNDASFVAMSDLTRAASKAVAETGAPASMRTVLAYLTVLFRHAELGDEPPATIASIAPVAKSGGKSPRDGDIIAIPAGDDQVNLAVVVAQDRFGTALGVFDGRFPADTTGPGANPKIRNRPVYTGDEAIKSGRWKVVGHDEARVKLFSRPEIYHRPGPDTGANGAAEIRRRAARDLRRRGGRGRSHRRDVPAGIPAGRPRASPPG